VSKTAQDLAAEPPAIKFVHNYQLDYSKWGTTRDGHFRILNP